MWAILNVITRVFPEPAPAIIKIGPFIVITASYCSGFNSFLRSDKSVAIGI